MNNMTNNAFLTSPLPQVSQPDRRWADGLKRGLLLRSATAIMSLGLCASALSMLTPASAQTTLGGHAKSGGLIACYHYGGGWNDSGNWNCDSGPLRVPGVGDVAIVDNVTATLPAGAFSVGDIQLRNGASIEGDSAATSTLIVVDTGKAGLPWEGSSDKNIRNVTLKFNGAAYELDVSSGPLIVDNAIVEFNATQTFTVSSVTIQNGGKATANGPVRAVSAAPPPPSEVAGELGGEGEGVSTTQFSILDTSQFVIASTGSWSPEYDMSIRIDLSAVFDVSGVISPSDYNLSFDNGSLTPAKFVIRPTARLIGDYTTISGDGILLNRGTISGAWTFDVPLLDNQGVLELEQEDIDVWGDFKQSGPDAQIRIDVQQSEGPYFGRLYVDGNVDLDYVPTIAKIVLTGDYVGYVEDIFYFIHSYDGDIIGSVADAVLNGKTIRFSKVDYDGYYVLQGEVIVVVGTAPTIISGSPADGRQGQPYSFGFTATGTPSITWSIIAGSLPPGLTLNSSMGVVSGTPTSIGTSTFTIQATNGAGSISQATAITIASPIFSIISLSTNTLNFGSQEINLTSPAQLVTVTNTGNSPFNIFSISGIGDFGYTSDCSPAVPLQPNGSCTLSVTFTPLAAGLRTGRISVSNNADQQGSNGNSITLSGTGIVIPQPNIILTPATTRSFGDQAIGTTSASQIVFVSNTGQLPLILSNLSISTVGTTAAGTYNLTSPPEADNPFNFPACNTSIPVAANSGCALGITFTPLSLGNNTARLDITHNATSTGGTAVRSLNLIGTGSPRREPLIRVSGTITFAEQVLGTTSEAKPVTVTNIGTADLNVGNLTITPNNPITLATDFAVTGNCGPQPLPPNTNCTLNVSFTPNATGSIGPKGATLNIASNAANTNSLPNPAQVALLGTAVPIPAPGLRVTPSTISFGNVLSGGAAGPTTLTVTNTGVLPLIITSVTSNLNDYQTTSNSCTVPIAPNGTCTIQVSFSPLNLGVRSGTLTINSNALTSPDRVPLTGKGCNPPIISRFFISSC